MLNKHENITVVYRINIHLNRTCGLYGAGKNSKENSDISGYLQKLMVSHLFSIIIMKIATEDVSRLTMVGKTMLIPP